MQAFRFHTEPFPQKNPEAFAPGIFLHAMQHKKFALSHSIWQQGQKH